MAINAILAMTAAEIRANTALPPKIGWMACHFSPCGTGLSNLPNRLPPGSMLILNDFIPIHGHDPDRIVSQLKEVMDKQRCESLLLDFQRESDDTGVLTKAIVEALPCPVGVSELYAKGLDCPAFLSPVPPDTPLTEYLKPWHDREIWLDAALNGSIITLTADGAASNPLPPYESPGCSHSDEKLHCHYSIALTENQARFTLFRTPEDLAALLEDARTLGISKTIGLWQELGGI